MVVGLGDGWLRLMTFDMSEATPSTHVRTYSSHYRSYSTDTAGYAGWYREHERPRLTDDQFMEADDFTIDLSDFNERFKPIN